MRATAITELALALAAAACGDGVTGSDAIDAVVAHPDAGVPSIAEADECSGAAMVPRSGVALAASSFRIAEELESFDLDGDEIPDNAMRGLFSLAQNGLAGGTFAIPLELFDRGVDPDACVKLALYRGACAVEPCDFTDTVSDAVSLDGASIAGGTAVSRLRAMRSAADGTLGLAGPGYLELVFPFFSPLLTRDVDGFVFPLTVTRISGVLTPTGLSGLHVAGVLQAFRLGQLPAPDSFPLMTTIGDTELDAIFAKMLGFVLPLPGNGSGCLRADVDVDGDGLEAFCRGEHGRVDRCIDGNGVELRDGDNGVADCSQAMKHGRPRFVDGISAQFVLSAEPASFTP